MMTNKKNNLRAIRNNVIILVLLTVLIATPLAALMMPITVSAQENINAFRWVATVSGLNIREQPNTSSRILATVPQGSRLWVSHASSANRNFVRVRRLCGTEGWVYRNHLRADPIQGVSERLSGSRYVSTSRDPLNARWGPGSNHSVRFTIPRGISVRVEYAVRVAGTRWVFVRLPDDNRGGYVSDQFLSTTRPTAQTSNGNFLWPVPGHYRILSPFGWRASTNSQHNGIDIVQRAGRPASDVDGARVVAVNSGRVKFASWDGGYGNTVRIDHGNGIVTLYAHLRRIDVRVGQQVNRGQQIGLVGSTGNSQGPHLHFGVIQGGRYVNPEPFLR